MKLDRTRQFKHDLSSNEVKKLKKLEKFKLVVSLSVTYGETTRNAPSRTMTGGRANGKALRLEVGENRAGR